MTPNSRSYLNQFSQPDSIIPDQYNPADYNRYAYVRYNPVRNTDPSGHCTVDMIEQGLCDPRDLATARKNQADARDQYLSGLDPEIRAALELLASTTSGADIAAYIIDNQISISIDPNSGNPYTNRYEDGNVEIFLAPSSQSGIFATASYAGQLAHEGYHAQIQYGTESSLLEEFEAFEVQNEVLTEINQSGILGVDSNGNPYQIQSVPGFPLTPGFDERNPEHLIPWFDAHHSSYTDPNPLAADEDPTVRNQLNSSLQWYP